MASDPLKEASIQKSEHLHINRYGRKKTQQNEWFATCPNGSTQNRVCVSFRVREKRVCVTFRVRDRDRKIKINK